MHRARTDTFRSSSSSSSFWTGGDGRRKRGGRIEDRNLGGAVRPELGHSAIYRAEKQCRNTATLWEEETGRKDREEADKKPKVAERSQRRRGEGMALQAQMRRVIASALSR